MQEGVRQPVEAVATYALRLVAPRNRQKPGHARQVVMKRRIEAGDLRQLRKALFEGLDQPQLFREVLWVDGGQLRKFLAERLRDASWLCAETPAVHHAMAHGSEAGQPGLCRQAIEQLVQGAQVIGSEIFASSGCSRSHPFSAKVASGDPMRSIAPDRSSSSPGRSWKTANFDSKNPR